MQNLSLFGKSRNRNMKQGQVSTAGRGMAAGRLAAALAGVLLAGLSGLSEAQAPVAQSSFAQYLATVTNGVGTGALGYSGDGGPATAALLNTPTGVGYDAAGNLYVCDMGASVIRKVTAATGIITTVAGTGTAGYNGDNQPANTAQLNTPQTIAVDAAGDIYIGDIGNFRVRLVSAATGIITTIAGNGTSGFTGDGGPANMAEVTAVNGLAVDALGDVFLADSNNARLREISAATGTITTVAGTGSSKNGTGTTGNGGPALQAIIQGPRSVAVDPRGLLYLNDRVHDVVRIVTLDNNINAFIGTGTAGYTGDGSAASASTTTIAGASSGGFVDALGNFFLNDSNNNAIRVVDRQTGKISTLNYLLGGVVSNATTLNKPQGSALGPNGQFAIADSSNHLVRTGFLQSNYATTPVATGVTQSFSLLVDEADTIQSIALTHAAPADFTLGAIGNCVIPGAIGANFSCVAPVTFNPTAPGLRVSQVLTTDAAGGRAILPVTGIGTAPAVTIGPGLISTLAGGTVAATPLVAPSYLALDGANNLYVVGGDSTVRVITPAGASTLFAGTGTPGLSGDGGAANAATLNGPTAVAIDTVGNVYISDTGNNVIREVGAEAGIINSITYPGFLSAPRGIATDLAGNLYIADSGNSVIRELNRFTGDYSILAGVAGKPGYSGDNGPATAAMISAPNGVLVDATGNVYFSSANNVVRKITTATGIITTVAGSGVAGSTGDGGLATAATLNNPAQLAIDAAGDLYITGTGSNKVRVVSAATGFISTLAGTGTQGYTGDGGASTAATLNAPAGVVVDQLADVLIADTGNNRIAQVAGTTTTLSFGSVSVGGTGTQTATITNFGNQNLTLGAIAFSAGFVQQTSTTGTNCAPATVLAAGASCTLTIAFSPTMTGPTTGTATITDNALNNPAAAQTITLVGTGAAGPASITVASGSAQTITPYTVFPLPLVALVADSKGTPISGITVTFTAPATGATGMFANGGTTTTAVSDPNGHATVMLTAGGTRGTFNVSASVISVATAAMFTETIAGNPAPTLTLSYTPVTNPITYGASITLNATATPPGTATAPVTGMITFLDNGVAFKTVAIVNGAASTTLVPSAGSHSYTISYGGDANYSANTTTTPQTLTVNPLNITANANSVSIPYGSAPPALTGTLNGVLPADSGSVVATFMAQAGGANIGSATPVGVYAIVTTLSGSAAGNYKVTSTSGTVTITPAATLSALSAQYTVAGPGVPIALTDTLTSTTSGTPTGSVSFYDGGVLLGSMMTSGSGGNVSTFTTSSLALGTHVITAVYAGSANFQGSTSNAVTIAIVNPDLALTPSISSASVIQGGNAIYAFGVTAIGSLTSTVSFACSGLPANSVCTFTGATFTPTLTVPTGTELLTISTTGAGNLSRLDAPARPGGHNPIVLAGVLWLPFFALLIPGVRKRRKAWRALAGRGLVALLAVITLVQLSGCSGSQSFFPSATPAGTSTVTITATSGTIVRSTTVTLTVTPHLTD